YPPSVVPPVLAAPVRPPEANHKHEKETLGGSPLRAWPDFRGRSEKGPARPAGKVRAPWRTLARTKVGHAERPHRRGQRSFRRRVSRLSETRSPLRSSQAHPRGLGPALPDHPRPV